MSLPPLSPAVALQQTKLWSELQMRVEADRPGSSQDCSQFSLWILRLWEVCIAPFFVHVDACAELSFVV